MKVYSSLYLISFVGQHKAKTLYVDGSRMENALLVEGEFFKIQLLEGQKIDFRVNWIIIADPTSNVKDVYKIGEGQLFNEETHTFKCVGR